MLKYAQIKFLGPCLSEDAVHGFVDDRMLQSPNTVLGGYHGLVPQNLVVHSNGTASLAHAIILLNLQALHNAA